MPAALELSFDPHTIQHLGSNMYSRLPNAVAELVANSYDADATTITVAIEGKHPEQEIVVTDDGHGMSRDDLQQKYLRIGRNRRGDASTVALSESGKRKVSGKKGLGKLALFGIGGVVEIRTTRTGSKRWNSAVLRWQDILKAKGTYSPVENSGPSPAREHRTTVRISSLSRKTPIDLEALASSLSSLFCYADSTLTVTVVGPDGCRYPVNTEARLNDLVTEFRWPVPEGLPVVEKDRAALAEWGSSELSVGAWG